MSLYSRSLLVRFAAAGLLLVGLLQPAEAALPGMRLIRLGNSSRSNYAHLRFGSDIVLTDSHAVVGEAGTTGIAGRVHVFSASTGQLIKILTPKDLPWPLTSMYAMTADNRQVLAGFSTNGGHPGIACLFDIATGRQTKLSPNDGANDFQFGSSVALEGNCAIVGAPGAHGKGAVYVFDRLSGKQLFKLTAPSGAAGDRFGMALHAAQGTVVIGAPKRGGGVGAIYLANLATGAVSSAITCPHSNRFDFGLKISGSGGTFLVSSLMSGSSAGPVYRFHFDGTSNGSHALVLPNGSFNFSPEHCHDGRLAAILSGYGVHLFDVTNEASDKLLFALAREDVPTNIMRSMAIGANRLLIGAPDEDLPGADSAGAAYLLTPLPQPVDMEVAAVRGEPGPQAPGTVFASLHQAVVSPRQDAAMISTLSGPASNGGRDAGAWLNLRSGWEELASRSREDLGNGVRTGTLSGLMFNHYDYAVLQSTLTGQDITPLNNRSLSSLDFWGVPKLLLRTGSAVPGLVNSAARLLHMHQVTQSAEVKSTAVAYALRQGVGGVAATNDTGILLVDNETGAPSNNFSESGPVTALPGVNFGQFLPRIAFGFEHVTFASALSGPAELNAGVFVRKHNLNPLTLIARKGAAAPGATGTTFSTFLGEATSRTEKTLIRATLSGAQANSSNNEGLWYLDAGLSLLARKGSPAPLVPGATIDRLLHAAPLGDTVLLHLRLRGASITTANDEVVLLYQGAQGWLRLLRKGDPAPGCQGALVSAIQGLETDLVDDDYAILIGLRGTGAASNQALLRGSASAGSGGALAGARRPELAVRKGTLYLAANGTGMTVTSISLPHGGQSRDQTGVGGKGLATLLRRWSNSPTRIVTRLSFNDGTTRIVTVR